MKWRQMRSAARPYLSWLINPLKKREKNEKKNCRPTDLSEGLEKPGNEKSGRESCKVRKKRNTKSLMVKKGENYENDAFTNDDSC